MTVFVANTNVLDLIGLHDEVDETYINDADVVVTVKDASDVEVQGVTWPLTMAYVAASDGDYRGILSDELAFVARQTYYAHITADAGSDRVGRWKLKIKPITRTGLAG